jgi:hypothetical protein
MDSIGESLDEKPLMRIFHEIGDGLLEKLNTSLRECVRFLKGVREKK